jgi:hypothetical protein
VAADPRRNRGPTPCERAKVEIFAHPWAVIDRVIVPQTDFASQFIGNAAKVHGRLLHRAYFFAGPIDLNGGINQSPKIGQIVFGPRTEHAVKDGVVRIITWASIETRRSAMVERKSDNLRLPLGEIGQIAAHIVEQDGEIVETNVVKRRQFRLQRGACIHIEIQMRAIGCKTDAKTHPHRAALR